MDRTNLIKEGAYQQPKAEERSKEKAKVRRTATVMKLENAQE